MADQGALLEHASAALLAEARLLAGAEPGSDDCPSALDQTALHWIRDQRGKLASAILAALAQPPTYAGPRIAEIQAETSRYYRVPVQAMTSNCRTKGMTAPRQVAMYLAHRLTRHSLAEVGRRFDRDHTTVIHAVRAVKQRRLVDAELELDLARICGTLGLTIAALDERPA